MPEFYTCGQPPCALVLSADCLKNSDKKSPLASTKSFLCPPCFSWYHGRVGGQSEFVVRFGNRARLACACKMEFPALSLLIPWSFANRQYSCASRARDFFPRE